MRLTLVSALIFTVWACRSSNSAGSRKFTESCSSDAECVSGRCLEGPGEVRFCSQECDADAACASNDTLYCCESLGDKAYCVRPADQCRQPGLADACSGPGDPYCARGNMTCEEVGGRRACTFECLGDTDCADSQELTLCQAVNGRNLCVPIDVDTLPRRESNCIGDRDCPANEVCQIDFDNRLDPRQLITVCSSELLYGAQKAYTACTANGSQCDRFFCINNFCPAVCLNDSHCAPGFDCLPQPIQFSSGLSILGLCAKRNGSGQPCDKQAAECTMSPCAADQCPPGEACGYRQRFDGSLETACQKKPTLTQTSPPVSSTYARLDQACSPLQDHDGDVNTDPQYQLVGGEVKLCDNDLCLSSGFCSAPCLADADCGGSMTCTHFPFQPHCERPERTGAANGAPCSGNNPDVVCASLFCNAGTCAARKPAPDACARDNECLSFACVDGACQKLCRDDASCAAGQVCQGDPRFVDVFGTGAPQDDVVESPAFCTAAPGAAGVGCPGPSGCPGQVCRTFTALGGGLRGVCADAVPNGAAAGASCTTDSACASNFCLLVTATSGVCSELCRDDSTCAAGNRCLPVTNLGTTLDTVCGTSPGSAADGAACTLNRDCASFLCVENTCRPLCSAGVATGAPCPSGGICAPVAVAVDPRWTEELFDDRYGTVLACVEGATGFTGDPSGCPAPREFVFRNAGGSLVAACLTPISDARPFDAICRSSTECKSGLCVDGKCSVPCTTTPADTCTTNACDLAAPAMLGEYATLTTAVAACRKTCSQESDCAAGQTCDAAVPRFCR